MNALKKVLNAAQNTLGNIIKSIFSSNKDDSKQGAPKEFKLAKDKVGEATTELAKATIKLDQKQSQLREAERNLAKVQIEWKQVQSQTKSVTNYVLAVNEASQAYAKAVDISKQATQDIEEHNAAVGNFEISIFKSSQGNIGAYKSFILGILVGMGLMLLIFIRRKIKTKKYHEKSELFSEINALRHLDEVNQSVPEFKVPAMRKAKAKTKKKKSVQTKKISSKKKTQR